MSNLQLPGNPRYQPKKLQEIFSYDNLYRSVAEVEIANLRALAELAIIPREDIILLTPEVEQELLAITTTEVDKVEREITKHDIRAWVRIAQSKVDPRLGRWLHLLLTSYDVLDTARTIQFVRGHQVVQKLTYKLIRCLISQVRRFASTPQIGRTHGQHALPITVGFWLATFLSRVLANIQNANTAAEKLVGKISGAVGAYNAQVGLGITAVCYSDGPTFEERVLWRLGLKPALISTQILPPEPLADYLFACLKLSATFGQFGRDGRHLMRTEIGELCEPFEAGQVGSSTMAHKRNPINFENLEGTWQKNQAEFWKVMQTMVSEHQRDLTGSTVARDFPTIVVNLVLQLNTLLRPGGDNHQPFISRLAVDEESCRRNLNLQGDAILAEPIYIALQMAGFPGDAHHLVNHVALPFAREKDVCLLTATKWATSQALPSEEYEKLWHKISLNVLAMLGQPESYIGQAKEKALQVAEEAERYLMLV